MTVRKQDIFKISSFKIIAFKKQLRIFSYRRCGKKRRKKYLLVFFSFTRLRAAQIYFSQCNMSTRWLKHHQLLRRSTFDLDIDPARPAANPLGVGQGPTNLNDGVEDVRRVHGLQQHPLKTRLVLQARFGDKPTQILSITGGHSKEDQILLVKIGNYIGFCV